VIRGVLHRPDAQLILVDTPGLHRPRTLLGERLNDLVRGTWSEVDLSAALWKIPAARMKSGREHRVPLSKPAIKLLHSLPGDRLPEGHVFPGMRGALSDMSLTAVLRRMGVSATAHGFRSTFRDWVAECTDHSREVAEMALAHAVGDRVEAAYRRGDLFEKRLALMSDWASFLSDVRNAGQEACIDAGHQVDDGIVQDQDCKAAIGTYRSV